LSEEGCSCRGDAARAHADPAYRRALWLVVVLNLGFGLAEMVGGFLAGSQALKADSLDFIGDGSISLLGLLALAGSPRARGGIALAQGLFLGAMGVLVLAFAAWRALNATPPEAGLMGGIGIAALAVNASVVLLLLRFRAGDANVRAIWLFSRNDSLANVAVIVGAAFVAAFDSAWPDILVAVAIAALFLHSAFDIVSDARRELRELS
jgi:cation diffusion facilitator family transporter